MEAHLDDKAVNISAHVAAEFQILLMSICRGMNKILYTKSFTPNFAVDPNLGIDVSLITYLMPCSRTNLRSQSLLVRVVAETNLSL